MQLYHNPLSSNARRVAMTAAHLGIRLDSIEVNLMRDDDRRRLQELNPNVKVPVLVDGELVLWASCAIMQYLADGKPDQALYPRGLVPRTCVNRWMFWACQHFSPAIGVLVWEQVWKKIVEAGEPDPRELARGTADLQRAAAVLDKHLSEREWLVGGCVTLAEYAVAAPLMYMEQARLPLDDYPQLLAWFARVRELPAWRHTTPVW
ncbi:glutathione S-transferase family protein [Massilia sp. ST3]|uniref:glutathione S-transferase family protein n=1 Tax=Massilia sp. ST3 TaxID=2824903 RepID=UPI001B81E445|nr:glutathione S-transferase family protein [Massilia sp. ST3]MBQ5948597.1 glutathione S-transferase family protein [Massilia sp. ST3]